MMDDKIMNVNEIFFTIQGEGYHSGKPAIFVRLQGCNLKCDFCDTEFTSGKEMEISTILAEIMALKSGCNFIVITGGEPGTQKNLPFLIQVLKKYNFYVAIETNGMFNLDFECAADWITFSPKCKAKGIQLTYYHEMKWVMKKGNPITPIFCELPYANSWQYIPPLKVNGMELLWLSPENPTHDGEIGSATASKTDPDTLAYTLSQVMKNPRWRLNIQLHKYVGAK
jgi:7-carboxy-7-deazaguanine synthase